MLSVRSMVNKWVEQLCTVRRLTHNTKLLNPTQQILVVFVVFLNRPFPLLRFPVFGNLVQNIYFVIGSFNVVLGTLLNFESYVRVELQVFRKPNCGEMTPAEFLNNYISIQKNFSDVNWVIASDLVVWHALILTTIFVLVKALSQFLSQRIEVFVILVCILCRFVGTGLQSFVFV